MIEDVSEDIRASDVEHHVVHFYVKDGALCHYTANLSEDCYRREREDGILKQKLKESVEGELMAHFKYMMFADRAERRGMKRIANLFRALAASAKAPFAIDVTLPSEGILLYPQPTSNSFVSVTIIQLPEL